MIYYKNSILNHSMYNNEFKFPLERVDHSFPKLYDLPKYIGQKLFISTKDDLFQCIDINTEEVIWQYEHKENSEREYYKGKFIVSDQYVVLGLNEGYLIVDSANGEVLSKTIEIDFNLSEAFIEGEFLYYSRFYYEEKTLSIVKKNIKINEKVFEANIERRRLFQLLKKDNYLYYWWDEFLYCHSAETGEELWKFDVGEIGKYLDAEKKECKGSVVSYPVFYDDKIIFHINRNKIMALNYKTGMSLWLTEINVLSSDNILICPKDKLHILGNGISSYWYYQLNPENGNVLFNRNFYEAVEDYLWFQKPLFTSHYFIMSATREKTIFAIDRTTFERVWEYKCEHSLVNTNSATIIDNKLYQLDSEGNLYAFEQAT